MAAAEDRSAAPKTEMKTEIRMMAVSSCFGEICRKTDAKQTLLEEICVNSRKDYGEQDFEDVGSRE